MSDILSVGGHKNDSTLVQTVISEARAIVNVNPSTPGHFSLFTLDGIFGGANVADLPEFQERECPAGLYILKHGNVPDGLCAVVGGLAMLEAADEAADENPARLLRPAEVVGFVETLTNQPLRFDVIASTDCIVRSIGRKDLLHYIADHPETRSRVIRLLAESVRDADRYLKSL